MAMEGTCGEFQGQTGLGCHSFSPDRLSDLENWREGREISTVSAFLCSDCLLAKPFPETSRQTSLRALRRAMGMCSKPGTRQAARPDTLQQGRLIPSWLPHLWHTALSLRLGCYGQPEAVSQSQSLPALPSSTDGSKKKKSGSRRSKGDLRECPEHGAFLRFWLSGRLYPPLRSDAKSLLGWAYAGQGSLLPIRTILLLQKTITGKGCRQVDRVTSHLAHAP